MADLSLSAPPPGGRSPGWEKHPVALCWVVLGPCLAAMVILWLQLGWPVPQCAFRALTGWPCLTCGLHRGLHLLLQGDWWAAWQMNPLNLLLPAFLAMGWIYSAALVLGWPGWQDFPGWRFLRGPGVRRWAGWVAWLALALIWWAVLTGPAGRS